TTMLWVILLVGTAPVWAEFLEPNCGEIPQEVWTSPSSQAHIFEAPWMAYLHLNGEFICGGSLINPKYVGTRDLCGFIYIYALSRLVRLGEFDTTTDLDCVDSNCNPPAEEFEVNMALRNRDYSLDNRYHDIGLLRLAKSVEYKAHIKPICLVMDDSVRRRIDAIQNFVATGWGNYANPSRTTAILKSIPLTRMPARECSERYLVECGRDQICVAHATGQACGGDSGGPMVALTRHQGQVRAIQVGLVSYGNPECRSPSVFTDVTRHVNWIRRAVEQYGG
ncbi:hypothetical protein KR018_006815, partial [Drosophila ironensis]